MKDFMLPENAHVHQVHGANRLGTNSLVDLVVFGKRAGIDIADYIKNTDYRNVSESDGDQAKEMISVLKSEKKGIHGGKIREEMQDTMMENVGIFRNQVDMKKAVETLKNLKQRFQGVRLDDNNKKFNTDYSGYS